MLPMIVSRAPAIFVFILYMPIPAITPTSPSISIPISSPVSVSAMGIPFSIPASIAMPFLVFV